MDNWDLYNYTYGGKSGSNATVEGIIDRSIKSIKNHRVTNIGAYSFYGCSQLTSIDLPNVTSIGAYAFRGCIKLTSVEFPNVTSTISDNIFYGCTQLTSADFANATAVGISSFQGCSQLTYINCPRVTMIYNTAFSSCTNLASIKLTSSQIVTLRGANAFERTPIASGTGFIYVPDELVESYKTATNWTVYADQIKGLSELEETNG